MTLEEARELLKTNYGFVNPSEDLVIAVRAIEQFRPKENDGKARRSSKRDERCSCGAICNHRKAKRLSPEKLTDSLGN